MNKTRKWKRLGMAVGALSLFTAACSQASAVQVETPPVVQVWTLEANQTGLIASGKIAPVAEIQVVSKLSGRVEQVHVKEGSLVKQGDVLISLEAADYVEQIRQAEAAVESAKAKLRDTQAGTRSQELQRLASVVEQAKAALQVAENSYNRMKALYDSGAITQAELEKTELELEKARTALEQAQAQYELAQAGPTTDTVAALEGEVSRLQAALDLAKNTYENTKIVAPISGIVAKRNIDPGEMAQAGVPLLMLVQMDQVNVEASVPQEHVNQLNVGAVVDVKVDSLQGNVFKGTVEFVSPISDANSSSFPIKVRVDNPDGTLRAGMLAEVYLPNQTSANEWKVPAITVVTKENKHFVYKVDHDVVHQVEVTVSESNGDWVTVLNGVAAGDQLVLNPDDRLTDGSNVIVN